MTQALDAFTRARILRFTAEFRTRQGQLPTLQDYERSGIPRETIERAVRAEVIELLYVTLTNGTIVKGYKPKQPA